MQRKILKSDRNLSEVMEKLRFDIWDLPSTNGQPYFSENTYYEFTEKQIDSLYDATKELHLMSLDYVSDVIRKGDYKSLGLNRDMISIIESTYAKTKDSHIYGRFDLAFDPKVNTIKMLEYNADTPTSLYESSIVQWDWQQYHFPKADQFNSIHENLIERWKNFPTNMYFTAHDDSGKEDWITLYYLLDTYLSSENKIGNCINLTDLGLNSNNQFVDTSENVITDIFKLYPWEYMQNEDFIRQASKANFIEPAWKVLLSNKSLLPELWKLHPNHPLLLESHYATANSLAKDFIKKPIFSREGSNVSSTNELDPRNENYYDFAVDLYASTGYVIQKDAQMPVYSGMTPVIGSWVVGDEPSGISLREDIGFTRNTSVFVPHIFI